MDTLHNNPPAAAELFSDEIESLRSRADAFGPVNDENAGDARDLIGLAKRLAKDIDAKRDEEKRPHLEAGRQIDSTYKPLVEAAKKAPQSLERALLSFINEQKRKAQEVAAEAARKAAEEAARAKALADDPIIGHDVIESAEMAEQQAEVAAASVRTASTVKGSEGFRAAGVRVTYKAVIKDPGSLVKYFSEHSDVIALCERLANAEIRASKGNLPDIPGVEIKAVESLV